MIRTSLTHPLRIDEVKVPGTEGIIGITFCPGKSKDSQRLGTWRRDLDVDLAAIRDWGAAMLISLIQEHEYRDVGVADMRERMPRGVEHLRLPIEDVSIPDAEWERRWAVDGPRIREVPRGGGKVRVHRMGGIGRSGLVAARDPRAVETAEQESNVRSFKAVSTGSLARY
jgi:ADP-ribosyl-[dinitrogen reductase] hydrolase